MKRKFGNHAGRKRADGDAALGPSIQTALRLPKVMYERLRKDGGERGLADEIRTRLQATLDAEKADAETRYLLLTVASLIGEVDGLYGPGSWHTDSFAFQVLTAEIDDLLAHFRPSEVNATKPNAETIELGEFFGDDPPEKIGKFTTRRWLKLHPPSVDVKLRPLSKDSAN
jgi:hypothetical protein